MKYSTLAFTAILAISGSKAWAQNSAISTVNVAAGGATTVTGRIGTPGNPGHVINYVSNNVAGISFVAANAPLTGDSLDGNTPNSPASDGLFTLTAAPYSALTSTAQPTDFAFMGYGIDPAITSAAGTPVDTYSDIDFALYSYVTPPSAGTYGGSYSGLTWIDIDNLSLPQANCFYTIHHRPTGINPGDYFSVIVPKTSNNSTVYDLKAMSSQAGGGPQTGGLSGYSALTYVSGTVTGYPANSMFYLHNDTLGNTWFGNMIPALTSASTDAINLTTAVGSFGTFGPGNNATLAYAAVPVGSNAAGLFYYLRLDSVTGNTILGVLNPSLIAGTRTVSDIANLGGVFSAVTFVAGATGPASAWGTTQFYVTGALLPASAQSVSFAAIADRNTAAGPFTVTPSASSGLALTVTLVPGSTGGASIVNAGAGVFTITPLSPGVVTLQATQSGGAFTTNMLRQSFNVTGTTLLGITTQPSSQSAVMGTTANFSVTASGTTPLSYQWRKAGTAIGGNASATTATLTLPNVQAVDGASYDVVVTNLSGSITSTAAILTVTGPAPVILNSPLTAGGTVGTPFTFTINASNSPTSYTASPLPAVLSIAGGTGVISGTPSVSGTFPVLLGATNAGGTGNATLQLTIAPAGSAPIITNNPYFAAGTIGTPLSLTITASGSPVSFGAVGLPAGLTLNTTTGVISGTPSTVGTYTTALSATNGSGVGRLTIVFPISSIGIPPVINNNPLTVAATVGVPFGFTITATGSPVSYSASSLPPGLSIVAVTGVITGTPTTAGTALVQLGATNVSGTGTQTLTIVVGATTVAPIITSPTTAPGTVGAPIVTYIIAGTGLPTSYTATGLPPGLTLNPLTGAIDGTPTTPGTYVVTITATNSAGTSTSTVTFTIAPPAVAPIITSPASAGGTVGTPFVTYLIAATGLPTSFTATGLPPGLTVNPLTGAINGTPTTSGTYTVVLTAINSTGTNSATLTISIAPPPAARIVNFSARAVSGPGQQSMIVGFVVAGNGKDILVRGIGPGLSAYGITSPLSDPMLTLYSGSNAIATNSAWATSSSGQAQGPLITSTDTQVGAFPLASGSADTALLATVNQGAFTTNLLSPNGTSGVALTEIYDTDGNPTSARLVNVSARMNVTANQGTLIAGVVIAGNISQTVLIRGVGPALASYGVSNVLADPQIAVYSGSTQVASNAGWGTGTSSAAQLSAAFTQVGAFPLPPGSMDSALLITLQPGAYTVEVTSVSGATGVALIEIYDTQ